MEDVGVVVVTHDLVSHSIRRLAIDRVPYIPPPVLGANGLLVTHIERLFGHVVVKGTVGKRGVEIAVAAPEHGPFQPFLLPPQGRAGDRRSDSGCEDGLDAVQRWGVKGYIENCNADDMGDEAEDQPLGGREIEDGSTR